MRYERFALSECETVVMKCIWNLGGSATCPEVITELNEHYSLDYKVTTVYTFLSKLCEKGFAKQEATKGHNFYVATITYDDFMLMYLKRINDFWFEGNVSDFVVSVVKLKEEEE